jgi:hypothetical protein
MMGRIGRVTDWIAEALGWVEEVLHLERWTKRDEAKPDRRNFPPPR